MYCTRVYTALAEQFPPSENAAKVDDDDDRSFYNEEIKVLLDNVMKWNGPDDGQGWWCPKSQTLEPAGGVCMMTLVNGEMVVSCAMSKDGKKIVVGGENGMLCVWDVIFGECL